MYMYMYVRTFYISCFACQNCPVVILSMVRKNAAEWSLHGQQTGTRGIQL